MALGNRSSLCPPTTRDIIRIDREVTDPARTAAGETAAALGLLEPEKDDKGSNTHVYNDLEHTHIALCRLSSTVCWLRLAQLRQPLPEALRPELESLIDLTPLP